MKLQISLEAEPKMLFACWIRLYLNSPVYKYSVDLYYHCHFIVWVMLDDVGLECAQQDLSFYDADWTAMGILQLGYRLSRKHQPFAKGLKLKRLEYPTARLWSTRALQSTRKWRSSTASPVVDFTLFHIRPFLMVWSWP